MRLGLGQTTAFLARARRQFEEIAGEAHAPPADGAGRLREFTGFGPNPGALRMWTYLPAELAPNPALVVVLHGCGQDAAGYDQGAGWSTLADRFGFALLYPEQSAANNPQRCFNWFQPEDTRRDGGEVRSIRDAAARMVAEHGLDPRRVFVTGLSAGGAMTGALLATYPDVFAGGAIIAGLPYGCAANVKEALAAMFQGSRRPAKVLGDEVRAASPHRGPWPKVSVWHGTSDTTVLPSNADETVKQWLDLHGCADAQPTGSLVDGYPRRVWRDAAGREVVEAFAITGMAHGTPLATNAAEEPHGRAAPFLLEAGIASSLHIARFWDLTGWRSSKAPTVARPPAAEPERSARRLRAAPGPDPSALPPPAGIDVGAVILKALRSAGLMK